MTCIDTEFTTSELKKTGLTKSQHLGGCLLVGHQQGDKF